MLAENVKSIIIQQTAKVGSVYDVLDTYRVGFEDYIDEINLDPEFKSRVILAEQQYINEINRIITFTAKEKLLDVLRNGQVTLTVKREKVYTSEGEEVGEKVTKTSKYSGVPISAIQAALSLIPELEKATASLIAHNAVPPQKLEKLQYLIGSFQSELRATLSDDTDNESADINQVMGAIQHLLVGSGE